MTNTFPLLNQIDEGLHSESIDWNKNAFQTLLVGAKPIFSSRILKIEFFPRLPIYQARPYFTMPSMLAFDE